MDKLSDEQLRELLQGYEVGAPPASLLARTKDLMRREMAAAEAVAENRRLAWKGNAGLVLTVLVLALLIGFNLFYVATVGTLLKMFLPSSAGFFLNQSMLGISVACTATVMVMVIVVFFKVLSVRPAPALNQAGMAK